jgi:hypothetical protein
MEGPTEEKDSSHRMDRDVRPAGSLPSVRVGRMGHTGSRPFRADGVGLRRNQGVALAYLIEPLRGRPPATGVPINARTSSMGSHRALRGRRRSRRNAAKWDSPRQRLGYPGAPWIPALKGPDVPQILPMEGPTEGKDSSHRMDRDLRPAGSLPSVRVGRMGHPGSRPSGRMGWGYGETRALPWPISSSPFGAVPPPPACRSTPGRRPWGLIRPFEAGRGPRRNAAKWDSPRQRLGDPAPPWIPALKGPDVPPILPMEGPTGWKDPGHRMDRDLRPAGSLPAVRVGRMGHPGSRPSGSRRRPSGTRDLVGPRSGGCARTSRTTG